MQLVLGVTLVYLSALLREDEEGQIQNRAEDWWMRVVQSRASFQAKLSSFFQGVAGTTAKLLDRIFGSKLISFRVVGMSILLTPASALVFVVIAQLFHFGTQGQTLSGTLRSFAWLCLWALIPAISDKKIVLTFWWISILIAPLSFTGLALILIRKQGTSYFEHVLLYLFSVFALSLLCDVAYLALTRRILLKLSHPLTLRNVFYLLGGHFVLLVILLIAPIFIGLKVAPHSLSLGGAFISSFAFNGLDVVVTSLGVVVGLALLVHHLIWSGIDRPLYAFQRFSPIQNHKKWMFVAGWTFILVPAHSLLSLATTMIEKL